MPTSAKKWLPRLSARWTLILNFLPRTILSFNAKTQPALLNPCWSVLRSCFARMIWELFRTNKWTTTSLTMPHSTSWISAAVCERVCTLPLQSSIMHRPLSVWREISFLLQSNIWSGVLNFTSSWLTLTKSFQLSNQLSVLLKGVCRSF